MDPTRFDTLTRAITQTRSRRQTLPGLAGADGHHPLRGPSVMEDHCRPRSRRSTLALGASLLAGGIAAAHLRSAAGQEATPQAASSDEAQFLFVQTYAAARLEPDPGDATRWILTLSAGTGFTLYFSDLPNRIVGTIPTDRFIAEFGQETADDPANAALVAHIDPATPVTHVVELLRMSYDAVTETATYSVRFLADPTELQIEFEQAPVQTLAEAASYGQSALFIDVGGLMQ
jgi:hypothetical protein